MVSAPHAQGPPPYKGGIPPGGGVYLRWPLARGRESQRKQTPQSAGTPPCMGGGPCAWSAETNYPAVINKLTPPAAAAQQVYYFGNRNACDRWCAPGETTSLSLDAWQPLLRADGGLTAQFTKQFWAECLYETTPPIIFGDN